MTIHESKKHLQKLLAERGIGWVKITAKTVSFADLARACPIFVTVHGASMSTIDWQEIKAQIPKPSDGGYVPKNEGTNWI